MTIMRLSLDVSNYLALERNLNALADNTDRQYTPSFLILTERSGTEHKCTSAVITSDQHGYFIQLTDPFGETDRVQIEALYSLKVYWQ